MNPEVFDTLRHFLLDALRQHGDTQAMADSDSLFLSGRLDSFSMMNLILFLESRFQLSFSDLEFNVEKVDSLDAIAALVQAKS
jgi:acyl carrier protein